MVLNMSRLWALRIPGAYLLAYTFGLGPFGIWWSMLISNTVVTVIGWLWFRKGTWKTKATHLVNDIKDAEAVVHITDLD